MALVEALWVFPPLLEVEEELFCCGWERHWEKQEKFFSLHPLPDVGQLDGGPMSAAVFVQVHGQVEL